jgi:hypothetical protein
MAIDTRERRQSVRGMYVRVGLRAVTPNASKDVEWRQEVLGGYPGIAPEAPSVPTPAGSPGLRPAKGTRVTLGTTFPSFGSWKIAQNYENFASMFGNWYTRARAWAQERDFAITTLIAEAPRATTERELVQRDEDHGLQIGDAVVLGSDGLWTATAQSDAITTLAQGIIGATFKDELVVVSSGVLRWRAHGLTVGSQYYLSPTTPGEGTTTPPAGVGEYVQRLYLPLTDDTVWVNMSGGDEV